MFFFLFQWAQYRRNRNCEVQGEVARVEERVPGLDGNGGGTDVAMYLSIGRRTFRPGQGVCVRPPPPPSTPPAAVMRKWRVEVEGGVGVGGWVGSAPGAAKSDEP